MKLKRLISVILICTLALGCFGIMGCGKNKTKVEKQVVDHVYKMTTYNIPENTNVNRIYSSNGKTYVTTYTYDENWNSTYSLCELLPDGTLGEPMPLIVSREGNNSSYINTILFDEDGSLWAQYTTYFYDPETSYSEETFHLTKLKADGSFDTDIVLNDFWDKTDGEYRYINRVLMLKNGIVCVQEDNTQTLYFIDTKTQTLAKQLKVDTTEFATDTYMQNMLVGKDGNLLLMYVSYGETSSTFMIPVDTATFTTGTKVDLPSEISNYSYNAFTGPGYDLYYNTDLAIFGYDMATQTSTELLNWINSDISNMNSNNILAVSADQFLCITYDELSEDYRQMIAKLDRVPDDQVVPKYILTLAGVYISYDYRTAVVRFNRSSDEYRIVMKDYSEYNTEDDYNLGYTAFTNDIVAGNIPDIIALSQDLPVDSFASKGLFEDLYKYMDKDEELSREDFLTNVLEAYSTEGKLYQLFPTFNIATMVGKEKLLNGISAWNMKEFTDYVNSLPQGVNAFYDMTRDQILQMFIYYSYDSYIDRETGTCSFDSDEFKQLLTFANTLSNESIWDKYNWEEDDGSFWESYDNMYREDRTVLMQTEISDFISLWNLSQYNFGDDKLTLIGFPNKNRSTGAITSNGITVAMSAKSKLKEGAWEFIKYFVSEDYYSSGRSYGFPVRISELEKKAQTDMERDLYINGYYGDDMVIYKEALISSTSSAITIDEPYDEKATNPNITHITQAEVDDIMNFIKSQNTAFRYNEDVFKIINEEAATYFAGQKSVAETAKIIQNRVQLYISESR